MRILKLTVFLKNSIDISLIMANTIFIREIFKISAFSENDTINRESLTMIPMCSRVDAWKDLY